METKDTAVENNQGAATGTEVNGQNASTDNDLLAQLAQKDELLEKVRSDKENYRKGLLSFKGKLKTDDGEEIDVQEIVRQAVQEQLASNKEAQIQAEKDALIEKTIKERNELAVALKNRSQISTGTQNNSTEDKNKVTDNILSEEKVAQFKKLGWTDEKIQRYKDNLMRNRGFI